MAIHKLTPAKIAKLNEPGMYGDGGGLWLQVSKTGTKSWVFRWTEPRMVEGLRGKDRNMGLGAFYKTDLHEARKLAYDQWQHIKAGRDPIVARDGKEKTDRHARKLAKMTVNDVIDQLIDAKINVDGKKERTKKRNYELFNQIRGPIGSMPIALFDTDMLLEKMDIYSKLRKNYKTIRYVLNRLERVFDVAILKKYHKGPNPARWKGHLDSILPTAEEVGHETEHRTLGFSWRKMGWFMEKLRAHRLQSNGSWARGGERSTISLWLEFAALTGCRVDEVRVAKWNNINRDTLTWTVPPGEHKSGGKKRSEKTKEERSIFRPITKPMLDVLDEMERRWPNHAPDAFIFRSDSARAKDGAPPDRGAPHGFIYDTLKWPTKLQPHAFRDVMKDWCKSRHPEWVHLIEWQCGRKPEGKNAQAYGRDGMLEERKPLMKFWAEYCSQPEPEPISDGSNVDQTLAERRKAAS